LDSTLFSFLENDIFGALDVGLISSSTINCSLVKCTDKTVGCIESDVR